MRDLANVREGGGSAGGLEAARSETETLERTHPFQWLVRAGFVARGITYGVIGALAAAIAVGAGTMGTSPNQQGALVRIAHTPVGRPAMVVICAGLIAYAVWKLTQGVFGYGPEGGGSVHLGPSQPPHLVLFLDTWDADVTNLASHLEQLNRYQAAVARGHLPPLVAVDEGAVEPSSRALPHLLGELHGPLRYPVGIDSTGRVGDGYRVQDEPWLTLISPSGEFLWYHDVSTGGWPSLARLTEDVRYALAHAPKSNGVTGSAQLSGSPHALAALHEQGGQLLGSALTARLRQLRGYPVVINAWASWCTPCQEEFHLFHSAALRYGRQVAFLGADTDDAAGNARAFLRQHPVSYPSYQTTTSSLSSLATFVGLPTTIFVDRQGNVVDVHTGQYTSEATLEGDIQSFALGR